MKQSILKTSEKQKKSFAFSLIKSSALNIALQAVNQKLNKDNIPQTLLVGMAGGIGDYLGGNTLMGALLGSGNALFNDGNIAGDAAKYAAIGLAADGLLKINEAKGNNDPSIINKTIDPHGYLKRKGVNYIHVHCSNIKEWTSEDAGSADFHLTSDKLEYKPLIAAIELAKSTKSVQTAFQAIEKHGHALFFLEHDTIKQRKIEGKCDVDIKTVNGSLVHTSDNMKYCINHPSQCYCSIKISIYTEEFSAMPIRKQIAMMAVVIGHELFIHKGLRMVDFWNMGNRAEAWNLRWEYRGEDGVYDHQLYKKKQMPQMYQYLTELKAAASKTNAGVTASDIVAAIKEHDAGL